MVEAPILYEKNDSVATVTLNRPKERNAMNSQMWRDIYNIFISGISPDRGIRVVILQGAGEGFCAGADITEFPELKTHELAREYWEIVDNANSAIEECDKPVLVKIHGFALGAGCALAMAGDIRVLEDRARMGVPAAMIGLTLGINDVRRMVMKIGASNAADVLLSGERYTARDARALCLATRVVPSDQLDEHINWLASKISKYAPLALQEGKRNIARVVSDPGLNNIDRDQLPIFWAGSKDIVEGVTAFLERRTPVFTGE